MTNGPDDHEDHGHAHDGHSHGEPGLPIADPPQRVSGMRVLEGWSIAGRPPGLRPDAEDAWRQTGFQLAEDWRLLEAGLDIQARYAASGYSPRARNMHMAAYASLWSRALLTTSDAAGLTRQGAYQSALALVRQAVELVGAQAGLDEPAGGAGTNSGIEGWKAWTHEAYGRHPEARADEVPLGHHFAGEAIARDAELRVILRAASDLSRPNFGPTALFTAAEASHERYPLIFGDRAFHFGWAQLTLGWLLRVDTKQLHLALHLEPLFPASSELREAAVEHVRAVEAHLADPRRTRLEEYVDDDGRRRHLISEFRRQSSDAPRRLLL